MAKRFDHEKLSKKLAPFGFALNSPGWLKGSITFLRASSVPRLHEHIRISGGRVAYAETVLSGATFAVCMASVSEEDNRFRSFLSPNTWYHTSTLDNAATARAWQNRLVENADAYCKAMATEKGPQLCRRLQPVFTALDSYLQRLGDIFRIFDREFAFVSEVSSNEQPEINRLTTHAGQMLYLKPEDATLASIALVRFGSEVEKIASPFQNKSPHRHDGLAARLILLADHVRRERIEYDLAGGLHR